ncbi:hypothetical protein HYQ46_000325 [Verticillium longisporum]|nr:hypothetical protein HYQ46_000325 [Verticillium longisporum]
MEQSHDAECPRVELDPSFYAASIRQVSVTLTGAWCSPFCVRGQSVAKSGSRREACLREPISRDRRPMPLLRGAGLTQGRDGIWPRHGSETVIAETGL